MDRSRQLSAAALMGWLALLVIAALGIGVLAFAGLPRMLWSFAGAALMLGATGYALQGWPDLPASAPAPVSSAAVDDPSLIDLRDRMLGRFTGDGAYLIAADAMTRAGDRRAAVQALLGGISHTPESVLLWTGLGTALAAHDGDRMSPPALFAFRRAASLSPDNPAPPFFAGLAYVRAGEFAAARPFWGRALVLTPAGATYRDDIAIRLALLDRYMSAMQPS